MLPSFKLCCVCVCIGVCACSGRVDGGDAALDEAVDEMDQSGASPHTHVEVWCLVRAVCMRGYSMSLPVSFVGGVCVCLCCVYMVCV